MARRGASKQWTYEARASKKMAEAWKQTVVGEVYASTAEGAAKVARSVIRDRRPEWGRYKLKIYVSG